MTAMSSAYVSLCIEKMCRYCGYTCSVLMQNVELVCIPRKYNCV